MVKKKKCNHTWDSIYFSNAMPTWEGIVCVKCGEYIEPKDIPEYINSLQREASIFIGTKAECTCGKIITYTDSLKWEHETRYYRHKPLVERIIGKG